MARDATTLRVEFCELDRIGGRVVVNDNGRCRKRLFGATSGSEQDRDREEQDERSQSRGSAGTERSTIFHLQTELKAVVGNARTGRHPRFCGLRKFMSDVREIGCA